MRKPFVVLFAVATNTDPRKYCEDIENIIFTDLDNTHSRIDELVHDAINLLLGGELTYSNFQVYAITDFMDLWNDELINPDDYFISYVYA